MGRRAELSERGGASLGTSLYGRQLSLCADAGQSADPFLGLGLCIHSRFPEACLRLLGKGIHLSRKERRALGMTAVSLGVYVLLLAFLAWGPWTLVRSITGDLSGSPLSEGIWCVTAFGLVLAGLVYGSATDFTGTTGISSAACRGVLPILLRDLLPYSLLFSFCRVGLYRTGRICRHSRDVALLDLHILLPAGV